MGRAEGKVAFITGAARGQGRSHAIKLAEEGADIIAVDIVDQVRSAPYPTSTAEDMAETVKAVEALDRRIIARTADIRDLAALTAVADEGVAEFGRLDIVLANAGISSIGPLLDLDEATWDEMIDINLSGAFRTLKATVPHIVAGGRGGSVVITSSLASIVTNGNNGHYSAAKAGLVALMKTAAKEWAPLNIRVNTIHPSTVGTPMILNDATYKLFRPDLESPGYDDFLVAAGTLNALPVPVTDPIDITNAILFLVSDEGRYITGTTQVVDAGGAL
jgi:(+)-trans-carveol dehydrogenase